MTAHFGMLGRGVPLLILGFSVLVVSPSVVAFFAPCPNGCATPYSGGAAPRKYRITYGPGVGGTDEQRTELEGYIY